MVTTKPCPRCNGTGKHSYNQITKDVCFKCGGTKVISCAPKHTKVKPTASWIDCAIGDIIKWDNILYKVNAVQPRALECTRLVDSVECIIKIPCHK